MFPELAARLESGGVRQLHVEHDQIGASRQRFLKAFLSHARQDNLESLVGEVLVEHSAQHQIIIDYKNARHRVIDSVTACLLEV